MSEVNLSLCAGCMRNLPAGQKKCPACGWDNGVRHNMEDALPEGTVLFRKYLIGRAIGRGGFGITYLGYDLDLQIKVAIKEYYPNGFCKRASHSYNVMTMSTEGEGGFFAKGCEVFLDEARTLAKFSSTSIVHVRDFFREHETAYIVMDFVEGITLKAEIARNGKIPMDRVLQLMKPLIHQLGRLHEKNIIHRDIKPENLMLVKDDEGERLVLLDFGAARTFTPDTTKTMTGVVTAGFAPLEQYSQKSRQGPYTDVYALCATMYNAITGAVPPSSLERNVDEVPVEPFSTYGVTVPEHVEAAIMHGLALRWANRTPNMAELLAELRNTDSPVSPPSGLTKETPEWKKPPLPPDPELPGRPKNGTQEGQKEEQKTENSGAGETEHREDTGAGSNPPPEGGGKKPNKKLLFIGGGAALILLAVLIAIFIGKPGPKSYTITWQDDSGNTIGTTEAAYDTLPTHEDLTKESDARYSYTFAGWTPEIRTVTGNATYRPLFIQTPRTYTIIWQDETGNTIGIMEAAYDTLPEHEDLTKESDARYSYTFAGWTPEIRRVTGNATYRASFIQIPRTYTITWQDENGKAIGTSQVAYGSTPAHKDLTKAADAQYTYTFTGWTPEIKTVTGNATYKATFRKETRKYTITWQDENGKTIGTTKVPYGTVPTHAAPSKSSSSGTTFTGWTPERVAVTGEAIYRATYKPNPRIYTITWQDENGKAIGTSQVAYGSTPAHKDLTKAADAQYTYTFTGWTPEIKTVTGNATYKATFRKETRKYTITWQDENGKALGTSQVAYGSTPTHGDLTKATDAQYTYTFKGWTPEIKTVTGNATYKATFRKEARKYTITWQDENGKTIGTTEVPYGTVPTHAAPSKSSSSGIIFTGWTPERVAVTGNATYRATYAPVPSCDWTCENCLSQNSFDDHFCPECGKTRLCLECGSSMPKEDRYCGNCRMEVGYWKCASCGEINLDENNICVNCTTKRHEPSNSQSAAEDKTNRSYTITWQNADGKTIDTTQVAYGEIPTHRGPGKASNAQFSYTFTGWTPDVKAVTGDATYKAKYKQELQKYNITWLDADGKRIDVTSVTYGEIPSHDDPARAADTKYTYSFAGWTPEIKKVTGFATYKAQFTAIMIRWTCENCQAENSFDDQFCPECGQTRVCLECGASAPKEDKYCGNCKMELGHWKCANCGENNPGEDVFCGNCAAKRHDINASELKLPDDITEYQGHYYKIFKTRTSWTNANSECKKTGGHLLTINSLKEQAIIRNFVTKSRGDVLRCWLGLTDNGKNGQWKNWITGEDLTYTNWAPGQPDSSDKGPHYASMACDSLGWISLGQWDDGYNNPSNNDFDKKSGYICEWESWDCSNCKRKGNTKNFCGECATSAPWMK